MLPLEFADEESDVVGLSGGVSRSEPDSFMAPRNDGGKSTVSMRGAFVTCSDSPGSGERGGEWLA